MKITLAKKNTMNVQKEIKNVINISVNIKCSFQLILFDVNQAIFNETQRMTDAYNLL